MFRPIFLFKKETLLTFTFIIKNPAGTIERRNVKVFSLFFLWGLRPHKKNKWVKKNR